MKYVVATLGSAGDLHPFLAIARALHEQGHDVLMLAQEPHRHEVEAQGVPFHAIASAHDHHRTLNHPALWHPLRGFGVLWRHLAVPAIEPTVDILSHLHERHGRKLCVLASPLVIGARLLRTTHEFRLVTAHTAPNGLRSAEHPMHLAGQLVPEWIPRVLREAAWRWLDRQKLDPMVRPRLQTWLKTHGASVELPAAIFHRWIHSPDGTLGLFPPTFGPMPRDWPVQPVLVGFPLYERTPEKTEADDAVAKFLAASKTPPFLLYPGSAPTRRTQEFLDLTHHLLARGRRCILLTPHTVAFTPPNSHDLCIPGWIELSAVLPACAAFIHHGGVGACAHGLAANIPQYGLPAAYDQHDNSWRLARQHGAAPRRMAHFADLLTQMRHAPAPNQHLAPSRPLHPNAATRAAVQYLSVMPSACPESKKPQPFGWGF